MSRPKGSKNRATILREAEVSMVDIIERRGREAFLDSLFVMEEGMRHYFSKAMQAKTNNVKAEIVDSYMQKAIAVAEKVAPYRHARLSAVKLAGDPNNPARFKDDATADELRGEIMKRLEILTSAGLIDLQALPAPKGAIANQPIPGGDQSGINGE
jgi:hypothetical protein